MSHEHLTDAERTHLQNVIALSTPNIADDLQAQAVIREAEANRVRTEQRQYIRDRELYGVMGVQGLAEIDRNLSELVQAGFPFSIDETSHVRQVLERDWRGEVYPTLVAERAAIERWLAALDATVRRMGYVKKR